MCPQFADPRKFAELTGLSLKEIRGLCRKRIIPNEYNNRNYRIDAVEAMAILKARAAEFKGHSQSIESVRKISTAKVKKRRRDNTFEDRLNALRDSPYEEAVPNDDVKGA